MVFPSLHSSLSPDAAVILVTFGLGLLFLECNRPGSILPGAAGLLGVLLAVAALRPYPLQLWAMTLLLGSFALLAVPLWQELPRLVPGAATLALIAALRGLVWHPRVSWITAVLCGALLGTASTFLADIARRARRAKQVLRQSR